MWQNREETKKAWGRNPLGFQYVTIYQRVKNGQEILLGMGTEVLPQLNVLNYRRFNTVIFLCVLPYRSVWISRLRQIVRQMSAITQEKFMIPAQAAFYSQENLEAKRKQLATEMRRWENYGGNNPNFNRSEIETLRDQVKSIEDHLKNQQH